MKKPLKERFEETPLSDLMPDFDKEAEWAKVSAQLHPKTRAFRTTWTRAAAILLFVAVGGILSLQLTQYKPENNELTAVKYGTKEWDELANTNISQISDTYVTATQTTSTTQEEARQEIGTTEVASIDLQHNQNSREPKKSLSSEFVCNGTPCPLEICIIQTVKCNNEKPSAISTCSILEPDQAKQIHYKAPDALGKNCKVTVDEIRIRRMTTGETIVLNANSKPSTAEELFDCLTSQENCNLLAGVFLADCNNEKRKHHLKIDNKFGNLVVQ